MNVKLKRIGVVWVAPVVVGAIAAVVGSHYFPESIEAQAARQADIVPIHFTPVNVNMPVGASAFPPGKGSDIANANCIMCHSTGMVLRQPALTVDEWATEINKMRSSFGAPIPADQVDALAHYLGVINGRHSDAKPSHVDSQGS
jgi:cytochrome c5